MEDIKPFKMKDRMPFKDEVILTQFTEKEIPPINDAIFDDKDDSFVKIYRSMTNNPELLKIMRKTMTLYLCLTGHIQRNKYEDDSFNLYNNYFKKGILAVAITETQLSRETGISRWSISKYVNHMKDNGIIEIDKRMRIHQKGADEHNIYILGTVEIRDDDRGTYTLFINKNLWKTPHNVLGKEEGGV